MSYRVREVLERPLLLPSGQTVWIPVPACTCEDRRGPAGGVCGNCSGAIPNIAEKA